MNIGITVPLPAYSVDVLFIANLAEQLGFDSLWCAEHPIIPVHSSSKFPGSADGEIPETYSHFVDPFIALSRASGVTSTIKLCTGITLIPERNPIILAKEVATLDVLSNGRLILGIGAGWLREETEILGGDFDHRWSQTRESIQIMKELWARSESGFQGQYYSLPPVKSYPQPIQRPHPPVILGGMAKNVLKRVVAWGDGWLPNRITPQELKAKRCELNKMATEAGRDPQSLSISIHGQPPDADSVSRYFDAGADRVIIRIAPVKSEDDMSKQLESIANELFGLM